MLNGQLTLTAAISPRALARPGNRMLPASVLVLALALAGCTSTSRQAPIVDMTQQPATSAAAASGTYVVKPGDSLYRIARNNNVDIDTLKRLNNLNDPNQIAVGQVLKLSASAGGSSGTSPTPSAPVNTPQAIATAPSKSSEPVPLDTPPGSAAKPADGSTPPATTPAQPATPAPAATPTPPRASDANVIAWGWPTSGAVTQQFNSNTKGIDLAGSPGDPVIAAADGKVMYSGNGVRGLGNLVIINHQSGFITAYAHNRALLVKTGQNVKRGAKIAEVGQTDTTSPKLHFEIRRQGTPVDPLQYLPAR
ncbi:peptidase [Bordetella ansorpii]|uniref:Peptidase n=1 Tax=Bordetella ansorpii TaxID=288768 RepID=A0A157R9Q3_9BORD|nr:peptidoglycan DD-metalloendopeptidase family protein [Bordetella ansorpii]SAI54616.1 peptidase [Bordetella ansorpii]